MFPVNTEVSITVAGQFSINNFQFCHLNGASGVIVRVGMGKVNDKSSVLHHKNICMGTAAVIVPSYSGFAKNIFRLTGKMFKIIREINSQTIPDVTD